WLMAKLAAGGIDDAPIAASLRRKVTSTIGMTELVPVSCRDGMAEPLGSGYLSLTALSRSDGWILVAAESQGFAAGSEVAGNRCSGICLAGRKDPGRHANARRHC